jgi:hypothetical protein
MDLRDRKGWYGLAELAQDRDQCRALVNLQVMSDILQLTTMVYIFQDVLPIPVSTYCLHTWHMLSATEASSLTFCPTENKTVTIMTTSLLMAGTGATPSVRYIK